MWYEAGTRKSNSGHSMPFWIDSPISDVDLDVDPGLLIVGGEGFERRVTALLNNCSESYDSWAKQLGKEKDRESATEYLQGGS